MRQFFGILSMNVVAIILALLACYMVYADKPYYGWVILASVITVVTPSRIKP